jgi:lysophospholipase L1-like esterase
VPETTVHQGALQTSYEVKGGDFTSALDLAAAGAVAKLTSYPFLSGVDVVNSRARGSIVALGDSITDGYKSHEDTNHRWPNLLANRLHEAGKEVGVLNAGISANRLLHDGPEGGRYAPGPNVLARFDADVLAQTGVAHVIVLEGINDLGHPGQSEPSTEAVSAEEMIGAFRQLIARAHTHGIKIYGCTILPFEGTLYPGFFTVAKDSERQKVNDWMRSSKEFDAVFDFDKALRDPARPSRLLPAYDSGDHLHPSDAGHTAMADTVDISLF